ncbi:MAG TPA: hypothetical protein V6D47_06705 [Oscillatoriaceae cyanobacterium]
MKTARCILALAVLAAGCQAIAPTGPAQTSRRVGAPRVAATTALPSVAPTDAPTTDPTRIVDTGSAVELIGKVKLISDKGLGLVDASTLISDKGLGIISNNGSGIISDKGSGIVSNNSGGYQVLADAPGESTLINATIEVLDGDGKLLVDKDGKPISAKSDGTGNYKLSATLPDENLWLRVSLPSGDQLSALLVRGDGIGQQTIDIDTASTLGATYVLQKYVNNSKTVYARLPATDAQKLLQDTQNAESLLTSLPSYKPSDVVAATDALRAKSTTLDSELTHIKNILLLGQSDLGTGLQATAVPLTSPIALYRDDAGDTFIAETIGRVRKVAPDGPISVYAGAGAKTVQGTFGPLNDMVGKPDGTLYLADYTAGIVRMISPAGKLTTVAGGGTDTSGNGKATDEKLNTIYRLAVGPHGSLYILEKATDSVSSRLLKVDASGNMTVMPALTTDGTVATAFGIAVTANGTLYVARSLDDGTQGIVSLPAGGTTWQSFYTGISCYGNEHMRLGPDGKLYLPSVVTSDVSSFDPTAASPQPTVVASGQSADGTPFYQAPHDVEMQPDGTLLIACGGSAAIFAVAGTGAPTLFAGEQGVAQLGDATGLALSTPAGISVDGNGNFVFSEQGSNTIKRLDGDKLELVAGGKLGNQDSVGAAAAFRSPTILASHDGTIYVIDSINYEVRAIASDGTVTTIAGSGFRGGITQTLTPEAQATFGRLEGIAVDPQGRVWFADSTNHQILRLNADGNVELVAGAPVANGVGTHGDKGDGGPAAQALLSAPTGMAFDKDGNLYFADTGNLCIRKIDTQGNISTVAGATGTTAELRLVSGQTDTGDVAANQALFVGPASLCMASDGSLYICELGSMALSAAGALTQGGGLNFTLPNIPARIRKLSADFKTVSIVAGPGGKVLSDPSADDALYSPVGLAIDGQGRMAIVDAAVDQIKILPAGSY